MKSFIAIADIHSHPWAAFAKGEGETNTRFKLALNVIRQSLSYARKFSIPWVCAGDIVHTAGYVLNEVGSGLVDVLCEFDDVEKLAVWGNHDARSTGGKVTLSQTPWKAFAKAVPNLIILRPDICVPAGGLTFSGAGAQPAGLLEFGLESDVGVYHGTVRGSVGPNGFLFEHGIDPEELWKRHRVSIVGDIHQPQYKDKDDRVILIPGSPEHHNFGDVGLHGYWRVTLEDGKRTTLELIPGYSPEFATVETAGEVKADGHYYRVRRVMPGEELPENALAIAPEPTTIQSRNLLESGHSEQALQAWLKAEPPESDAEQYLSVGRQLLEAQEQNAIAPMRLTRLRLENFCSYKYATLDVQPGMWLVVGKGKDYPSNGAGKTTLFEALYWLLFSRTTKGLSGDEVIRWGEPWGSVDASFVDADGHEIKARRVRGPNAGLYVTEDGEGWEATSKTDMTEKLTKRLGFTPELFQALGYFSQERLLLFASSTDGERKNMLADLIGLSAYQEASAAAASASGLLSGERTMVEGKQEAVHAQLKLDRQRLDGFTERAKSWGDIHHSRLIEVQHALAEFDLIAEARLKHLISQHSGSLGASLGARIASRERELQTIEKEIESAVSGVDGAFSSVAEIERSVEEKQQTLTRVQTEDAGAIRDYRNAVEQRDKLLHKTAIYKGQLEAEGVCPMCKQAVSPAQRDTCLEPWTQEIKIHNAAVEKLLELSIRLTNQLETAKQVLLEAKDDLDTARWWENSQRNKLAVVQTLSALQDEQRALESLAVGLGKKDIATERGMIASRLAAVQAETNPHTGAMEVAQESIDANATLMVEIDQRRSDIIRKQAVYAYWNRGFSKQGIQSLLVEEVAARFNALRAEIFPALTHGVYDVQFSTLSLTKGGETRERTEFLVTEHGKTVPYQALSGGQRRRIDLGVMLTLVLVVSEWMQVPGALGVLMLDEVFGFLDAAGEEGLMEALRAVQERVPSIFVVAHDPQLQALFPQVLRVVQDSDGISHLEGSDAATTAPADLEVHLALKGAGLL